MSGRQVVAVRRRRSVLASWALLVAVLTALQPSSARAESADGVPGPARLDAGSLAIGDDFGCAIVSDGSVRCWGNGDEGTMAQGNGLDVGDDTGESTVRVPLPAPAKALAAGDDFACAILDTGQLRCWGDAAYGALSTGNENDIGDEPGEVPVAVDLGPGRTAVAISAGRQHGCAILDTGQVRCWGNNSSGQLGQGSHTGNVPAPGTVPVNLPRPAVALAATNWSNCAILDNGDIRCWGDGYTGELMQGNSDAWGDDPGETVPVRLAIDPKTALAISGGGDHYCAVYDDHRVRCWGQSAYGELGLGRVEPFGDGAGESNVGSIDLPAGRSATVVAAGEDNSCAILDDGQLRCWGRNQWGQLGQGNTATWGDQPGESTLAVDVGGAVRAVGVGDGFVCAVTDTGLRCWGANAEGQLGQGSSLTFGASPGEVPRLLPAVNLGGLTVGRDSDGDGVRDAVDACPAVAGSGNGCGASTSSPPEAVLKGKHVVLDTVLAKTKATAKCPAKVAIAVRTKAAKGRMSITRQLKTKSVSGGCHVKGKVKLPAKPKKAAKVKVTVTGKKLKTKHLVAVRL